MVSTEKWTPLTFAIYNANLPLIQYLMENFIGNTKKQLKIPGVFDTQDINRLFPFVVAIEKQDMPMFKYFLDDLDGSLWNEETLENLFELLAKKDQTEFLGSVFSSKTTHTIFEAMSYQYRFSFIQHLL